MKKIQVMLFLGGKQVKFEVTANTPQDANELVKCKLIDSLSKSKITVKGLAD